MPVTVPRTTTVDQPRRAGRVLVVDDDADLADQLVGLLQLEGYQADPAGDGQRGLHLALSRPYDVVILDWRLPVIDGLDVVTRLRRRGVEVRVIMLSARSGTAERIAGLDAGADDYLPKPFELDELLARVRAVRRRSFDAAELIPLGAAQLDVSGRAVRLPGGSRVALTPREFQLMHWLAVRPGVVHTREQLRRAVFGGAAAESIVDTYVYYLRRKLWPDAVRTLHGQGYQVGRL